MFGFSNRSRMLAWVERKRVEARREMARHDALAPYFIVVEPWEPMPYRLREKRSDLEGVNALIVKWHDVGRYETQEAAERAAQLHAQGKTAVAYTPPQTTLDTDA